jgi:hypothetical protein
MEINSSLSWAVESRLVSMGFSRRSAGDDAAVSTTTGVSNLLLTASDWRDSTLNQPWLSDARPGYTFKIMQVGNDVVIEFVPEPSTWAMTLASVGFAGWMARRKKLASKKQKQLAA